METTTRLIAVALMIMAATAVPMKASTADEHPNGRNSEPADSSHVVDLDEVVVVAQPKESGLLRRQPMASTVFTDNEMKRANATELSALSFYVPAFTVPAYGSRYTSTAYVRGIGSRSGEPAIGVYCDNVPLISKATLNRHYYQMDRIDVLRGPQGTLYGINSEAGLVRMYTKNPMNYQGTELRMGIGMGRYSNVEVAKFHRPSQRFAFSVAAFYSGLGGFFDNANLGHKADISDEAGGRMRFLWKPTAELTFDLTADYQYTNQSAFAYGEYDEATGHHADPSTTFQNGYKRQTAISGLNITYAVPRLLLSSTTSHQYLYDQMAMDQDYMPQDYMRLEQRQKMNAVTEEISLRSRGPQRWQHASGLFFSYQWLHTNAPVSFGDDMNSLIVANMGMPQAVAQRITVSDNCVPGDFKTPQLNFGAFHETDYTIAEKLTATVGLRYDYQRVSIDYDSNARFLLSYSGMAQGSQASVANYYRSAFVGSATESYSQLLPKFALTYSFNAGNVYATVSKGFRAGGYNLQMFSDIFKTEQSGMGMKLMGLMKGEMVNEHSQEDYDNVNSAITYKPETSWNYEAGSHLNLLDGKMHLDLAVFFMQIHDQQLSLMAGNYGYGRMMVNAGRTASHGAEVALRGKAAADRLEWAATYGYTNSTFRNYTDSVGNADGTDDQPRSYRGKHVPFVPRHTFSVMADYSLNTTVTVGMNVVGNGETYWDTANLHKQKLYAVVGAHIRLHINRVEINIWGRNLTNTKYNTFLVSSSVDGTSRQFSQLGNPMQAGVDISVRL